MKIAPPDDDLQLRALAKRNEQSADVQDVPAVDASTPIKPISPTPRRQERQTREGFERRLYQRRRQQTPVLLDTRDNQDRRRSMRRADDLSAEAADEKAETALPRGIDVEA